MSVDNHPPRHTSVHNFKNPDSLNIYRQGSKRSLIHKLIYPYFNAYSIQELRAIILMKEKPITGYLTRKEYKKLLAQRERIEEYLAIENHLSQEQLNNNNTENSL